MADLYVRYDRVASWLEAREALPSDWRQLLREAQKRVGGRQGTLGEPWGYLDCALELEAAEKAEVEQYGKVRTTMLGQAVDPRVAELRKFCAVYKKNIGCVELSQRLEQWIRFTIPYLEKQVGEAAAVLQAYPSRKEHLDKQYRDAVDAAKMALDGIGLDWRQSTPCTLQEIQEALHTSAKQQVQESLDLQRSLLHTYFCINRTTHME